MSTFFSELAFVLIVLAGFGICGAFTISPFRARLPHVALASPLIGLLCVVLGTAVLYGIAGLPLGFCAIISAGCCIAVSIIALSKIRLHFSPATLLVLGAIAITVAAIITLTVDTATIRVGGPAVLYTHGTDHLGYAQLSDWVTTHPVSVPPKATPQHPQPAWAEFVFKVDPRFGSFYFLGIIQLLRHTSGAFSYDIACAVALCAGILGVAGVFARSWRSMLLVMLGLLVSCWFDYSRCGYLGKILGYPSALLVLGLFFGLPSIPSPPLLGLLVLIAGAASILYPGIALAMFIASVAIVYLPMLSRHERAPRTATAGLLALVCVLASGLPARPVSILSSASGNPGWGYLLPRILDLENQVTSLSGLSPGVLTGIIVLAVLVTALLMIASLTARDPVALSLLAGPLLLLVALSTAGGWVPVLQLIGVLFPFAVCGAAHLIDELPDTFPRTGRAAVMVLTVLMVGFRVPRFAGAVRRYAGSEIYAGWIFSKRDTDRLVRAIHRRPVLVDIDHPNQAIFVVCEIGRRNVSLQWTPRTWRTLFSYTDLRLPPYAVPAQLKLVSATDPDDGAPPVVYQTANLKLLDLSWAPVKAP